MHARALVVTRGCVLTSTGGLSERAQCFFELRWKGAPGHRPRALPMWGVPHQIYAFSKAAPTFTRAWQSAGGALTLDDGTARYACPRQGLLRTARPPLCSWPCLLLLHSPLARLPWSRPSLPQCPPKPPSVDERSAPPLVQAPLVDGRWRKPGDRALRSFVLRRSGGETSGCWTVDPRAPGQRARIVNNNNRSPLGRGTPKNGRPICLALAGPSYWEGSRGWLIHHRLFF